MSSIISVLLAISLLFGGAAGQAAPAAPAPGQVAALAAQANQFLEAVEANAAEYSRLMQAIDTGRNVVEIARNVGAAYERGVQRGLGQGQAMARRRGFWPGVYMAATAAIGAIGYAGHQGYVAYQDSNLRRDVCAAIMRDNLGWIVNPKSNFGPADAKKGCEILSAIGKLQTNSNCFPKEIKWPWNMDDRGNHANAIYTHYYPACVDALKAGMKQQEKCQAEIDMGRAWAKSINGQVYDEHDMAHLNYWCKPSALPTDKNDKLQVLSKTLEGVIENWENNIGS